MIDFGTGVTLRSPNSCDLEMMFLERNDPRNWQWFRQHTTINLSNHMDWYDGARKDPSIEMLLAVDNNETILAIMGLTSIDRINSRAEISYYEVGENVGKLPLECLVRHAFCNQNLNQVWTEMFDGSPYRTKFESLDFKLDGILRDFYFRNGKYINAHRYSLIRSWEDV
jgi:RimJ/RimL family protein N-acetyltransferase